jgi:hypothetical protein
MKSRSRLLLAVLSLTIIFCFLEAPHSIPVRAASVRADDPASRQAEPDFPPYHTGPPQRPLSATMNPRLFHDPIARTSYQIASKMKPILYQLPCYCGCSKLLKHKSLLDCYLTDHGAKCACCQKELIYARLCEREGKNINEIRSGIERGDWMAIVPANYQSLQ